MKKMHNTGRLAALLLALALILSLVPAAFAAEESAAEAEPAEAPIEEIVGEPAAEAAEEPAAEGVEETPVEEEPAPEDPVAEPAEDAAKHTEELVYGLLKKELLAPVKAEFAGLTDAQKQALTETWIADTYHARTGAEVLAMYEDLRLSPEATMVLFLANADAIVSFIEEDPGATDSAYLNRFVTAWKDFLDALTEVAPLDLTDPLARDQVMKLLEHVHESMCDAGNTEATLTGVNHLNELIKSYGEASGHQDAEAFLALFEAA